YPAPFFWIPVCVTLFSAFGLLRFYEENRIWYLYSPSGADSHYEHAVANEFFNDRGGKFWLEVTITARDFGNLLRRSYFDEVESLSNYLQYNFTSECFVEGRKQCTFAELCSGSSCAENQVVPLFNLIYRNVSSRLHPNFRLTYPTMHLYNDEYYVGEHFAGVEIDKNTNSWEISMFDYVEHFQHPILNITCNSDALIARESKLLGDFSFFEFVQTHRFFYLHSILLLISLFHQVRRNGLTCVPFFTISVALVYCFILITNRREHFRLAHSIFMAFLGVAGPLMAVGTTFCILFLLGFPFNSITLVMPFLIIGVGSDDVFIIIHAMRKTDKRKSLEDQIAETMEEAGPSITVTSVTNILSFGIGILTPTPAISIFCLYTCVGVAIDFVYQLTFFVAALVYEEIRIAGPEKPPIEDVVKNKEIISAKLSVRSVYPADPDGIVAKYCRILKTWQSRLALLFILIIYWAASIYGCLKMEIRMDTTNLVLKDSPLHNVAYVYENFLWKEGQLVSLSLSRNYPSMFCLGFSVLVFVNDPPDLSKEENQRRMLGLVGEFEDLPYSMGEKLDIILASVFSLSVSFVSNNRWVLSAARRLAAGFDAESGGSRWNDMMRLKRNMSGMVIGVEKFMFATASAMGEEASWNTRAKLQHTWREVAKRNKQYNVTIFQTYSFYVDQLDSIGGNTLSTVIVAAITMDLACFLMIPSASSIVSSSIAMLSINVGVFGLLSLWNVNLDPISMCTTLMSIGFSVDFTGELFSILLYFMCLAPVNIHFVCSKQVSRAHISYHFYRNPISWTTDERLADALRWFRSIGWPMIQAGFSTILCISPLLLIDSYMVYVFAKTIYLVIGLGLLHGIVFLPALLLSVSFLSF
ncbi:patched family protein, partial [Necator americanus]